MIAKPLIGIANRAMSAMVYAVDLGLTPSSRTRVTVLPEDKEEDEIGKYIA